MTETKGARQALRSRFLKGGGASLAPYELIELALYLSIPRRDVKPLAQALLHKYGSLQNICQRPVEELRLLAGVGDQTLAAFKTLHALALELTKAPLKEMPLVNNAAPRLIHHSRLRLLPPEIEQCLVYYVDQSRQLIMDEVHQIGTFDRLTIYPREIVRSALNCNAAGMILVHNHPNGNPYPSNKDLIMTRKIKEMCQVFNITVHDHIIVAHDDYYSFQEKNLL